MKAKALHLAGWFIFTAFTSTLKLGCVGGKIYSANNRQEHADERWIYIAHLGQHSEMFKHPTSRDIKSFQTISLILN